MSGKVALALFVVVMIVVDQFTKWLSWTTLAEGERVDVLPFLAFEHVHNTGIAFSMFEGLGRWPLLALACVVLVAVAWLWSQLPAGRPLGHLGFALIVAGALGNIIDRAAWGFVEDMIAFHLGTWSFAVFNMADAYISIGAALVVADELWAWLAERRAARRNANSPPRTGGEQE